MFKSYPLAYAVIRMGLKYCWLHSVLFTLTQVIKSAKRVSTGREAIKSLESLESPLVFEISPW